MDDSKDDPKDDSKDDQNGPKDDQDDPDNSDASGNDQEDQKPDQDETPDENTDSADSSDNSGKDDNGNSGNKDSLSDKNISPNPEKNGKNKEMSLLTVDYEDVKMEIDGITYTFDLDPDDHTATLKVGGQTGFLPGGCPAGRDVLCAAVSWAVQRGAACPCAERRPSHGALPCQPG